MAGGVDLMIPPGTAVRDAHSCYEVVVLVTVPDKPRPAPCCLLLPSLPPSKHDRIPLCGIVGDYDILIERLSQHPWRGNFSPQFTCTEASTQSVYFFFDAGEKIDEYDGRKSH
jgi:hypothetical protein